MRSKIPSVLGALVCWALAGGCGGSAERQASALRLPRVVEPRLSVTQSYAPCDRAAPDLGGRSLRWPVCARRAPASPASRHSVSLVLEPEECGTSQYTQALCLLVTGTTPEDTDRAIAMLETLSHRQPIATALNDLGAAYLIRAQRFDRPSDLVRAWDATLRARDLDPALSTASFNEAIICDALGLRDCLLRATEEYRQRDPGSAWALELEDRLRANGAGWKLPGTPPPAEGTSDEAAGAGRLLHAAIGRHLPAWAEAVLGDDEDARQELLAGVRAVAGTLSATGDSFLARAVDHLEAQEEDGRRHLAEAILALAEAAKERPFDDRRCLLQRAADQFAAAGSPLAVWAKLELARLDYLQHEYDHLLERAGLLREDSPAGDRLIHAQALWYIAAGHAQLGRYLEAIDEYQQALALYAALADRPNQLNIQSRLAELYRLTGRDEQGWHQRLGNLRHPHLLDQAGHHFLLIETSLAARSLGLVRAAMALQGAAVDAAAFLEDRERLAIALLYLADCHLEAGDASAAGPLLIEARRSLVEIIDEEPRQSIEVLIVELEGRTALAQGDPRRAVDSFTHAIELAADLYPIPRPALHAHRADAWLALGRPGRARDDLRLATRALEEIWQIELAGASDGDRVAGQDIWRDYLGKGRPLFDSLIRLLVETGQGEEALLVAERARARELLDVFRSRRGSGVALPADISALAALRARLPPRAVVLAYWLLETKIVVWRIDRSAITTATVPFDRRLLEERIDSMLRGLTAATTPQYRHEPFLRELYRQLIDAAQPPIAAEQVLLIVPDGVLHGVPFAALVGPEGFLVESNPIVLAPSVTIAVALQRSPDRALPPPAAVLAVSPAFDARRFDGDPFPRLAPLPGAVAEAGKVVELYPQGSLLLGLKATSEAFRRQIAASEIIHFSGHAVGTPETSYLVLAPDALSPSGALYPRDLLSFPFGNTRVVVLSACRSSGGHAVGALGVSRLVRPLLGAGVPTVVGSLWDVRDRAAPELMMVFHQSLRQGLGPASALRAAQRHMLAQEASSLRSIVAWAPFQVVGNAY